MVSAITLQNQALMSQTRYVRWIPSAPMIKRIGKIHTFLYVVTRGVIGGRLDGLDVLLLSTIGKRSGRVRRVPLPYFRSGTRYLVVASYGGNAKNPAWLDNLVANPRVDVQLGGRRWTTDARLAQGEERERLWSEVTREFPRYGVYQTKTERKIPIVVIDRPVSA
jgi:deazaflavin-dependent oxidoreductase (nitroreductase family)